MNGEHGRHSRAGDRPQPQSDAPAGSHAMRGDDDGMRGHAGMMPMQQPGAEMGGDHEQMLRDHRRLTLWTYFATIILGLWLIAGPATFGYTDAALARSDVLSGALIIGFGVLALWPRGDFWGRWGACLVGIWLLFAPLVFWAPSAAAYANDTLVGGLVIALAVLIPMMPGKAHHMAMMAPGPDIPPGWTYNPSTWWQRGPIIALALVSFVLARYMGAYQLEHIDTVWDPFFVPGTAAILTSDVSRAFPISDAGLGALAYLIEALSGFMGSQRRWRTMPWMVLMFGILVIPLGVTSIVLVILQPLAVGTWCFLCLLTALFMLVMIPFAVDEVVAMTQFMAQARREGQPLWRTFWVGGTLQGGERDGRTPPFDAPPATSAPAMAWGVTVPWTLLAGAAVGLWLMAAPAVLGNEGGAADSDHLVGALVTVVAVIPMAEVIRPVRFINVLFGAWLIAAPWLLGGATAAGAWNDVAAGALLIVLSLPRGPVRERYGGWDPYVR